MMRTLQILFSFLMIVLVCFGVAFWMLPLPGQIPILMYHFIDTPERAAVEKNVVSREKFEEQMAFLKNFGYHVISMDEYYQTRMGKRKPRGKEIVITFDDGNYTVDEQAFPIIEQHQIPVTLFVVSENIRKQEHGSMSEETLKRLYSTGLVTLASHSRTHPLLSQLSEREMREEILGSKRDLEDMFNLPIWYLAYPSGDLDDKVVRTAMQSGYRLAFTTTPNKLKNIDLDPEVESFSITRVKISRTSDFILAFWAKVSGVYDGLKAFANFIRMR